MSSEDQAGTVADTAAVRADDELLDQVADGGRPPGELAGILAGWRAWLLVSPARDVIYRTLEGYEERPR